ncbi:MAG: tetratricopeptide repeat protein [Candidatus Omnitrophica bacterium]|nr:tetratricopeptide repeat protein [Candidatus Omnitrophota bacterium]
MFDQRRHGAIAVGVGLWLIVWTGISWADGRPSESKFKGLAHYIMAVMDDLNGDSRQAVGEYEKSTSLDHQQPLPHLRLGAYDARMGHLDEAVEQLKVVVKLQPDSAQAHYLLALIYSSQKKYDLASVEYETVLKDASRNNPNNIEIHAYLAQLYYALHKYPQAVLQLTQILQLTPQNVSAWYLLGSVDLELQQHEKAKQAFRKVLALEPDHDGALNSLAYMYAQEGMNLDDALKMVRRAIELDPSNGAYYDTLGWVLFKKGMNAESLMALEKAQDYIQDPVIYEHMGDVYKAVDEPTLARKFWLKSLALDAKQPEVSEKIEQLNHTSAQMKDADHNPAK